jgi:D-mannose binding lectin
MDVIPVTNETIMGEITCTPWFFPGRLSVNQTMGGRGFTSLSSPNNRYVLRMQDDGNLVVIAPGNNSRWASNSSSPNNRNSILVLQDDGNIVIVAPGGRVAWASGTNGR